MSQISLSLLTFIEEITLKAKGAILKHCHESEVMLI
jgi:hypothetical protein